MNANTNSWLTLCAADIMSEDVVVIPREMSLQGAARLLARADVTGAPVVDGDSRCIGVLSATDFMHWVEEDHDGDANAGPTEDMCSAWQIPEECHESGCRVEDYMTADPVLASPGTRITELARRMIDAHIHRIIVVDGQQHPIGIVSSMDILAAVARADPTLTEPLEEEIAMAGAIY